MKKHILFLLLCTPLIMAKTSVTLVPYSSYIKYSGSSKKRAYVVGLYSSLYHSSNKFELGLENTTIMYNGRWADYDQRDITVIYTRFFGKHFLAKAGVHHITTDKRSSKHFIAGVNYRKKRYNIGLDSYYSNYKSLSAKPLKILQFKPYIGLNFPKSRWGSFYLKADYNYIKPLHTQKMALKKSYKSVGVKLSHRKGKLTTSVGGWIGKRAFSVEDGGFTVYNSSVVYTKGFYVSADYAMKPKTHIKFKDSYAQFKENGKKGDSNTVTTSLLHTW